MFGAKAALAADVFASAAERNAEPDAAPLKDLHAYESASAAKASIARYATFYSTRRPRSSLDRQTPDHVYSRSLPLEAAA